MKQKPILIKLPFTDCVYIATNYKQLENDILLVNEKFDVTGQFNQLAKTLKSEREKELEKLVQSLYADYYYEYPGRAAEVYIGRMNKLGIEVKR